MNWETRLKLFLKKNSINQQEYDEFVSIGKTLKHDEKRLEIQCMILF